MAGMSGSKKEDLSELGTDDGALAESGVPGAGHEIGNVGRAADPTSEATETIGAAVKEGLERFYATNGLAFGAVDIFCFGGGRVGPRVDAVLRSLLCFVDGDGRSPISSFVFVLPATVLRTEAEEAFRARVEALLAESAKAFTTNLPARERIQIATPPDLRQETVVQIVRTAQPRSIVIVCDAASFRADNVAPYVAPGSEGPTLAEDFWAPHLHALSQALADAVHSGEVYVILDAGQTSPHRPDLRTLLESVPGVGVLGGDTPDSPEAMLAARVDQWAGWLAEGRLGPVLNSINALPSSFDPEKPFLRMQMLHRAGLHGQALEAIEDYLSVNVEPNSFALAKLGRIAADAGAMILAARLVRRAVDELDTREALEFAYRTADNLDDGDLRDRITARFERLFPGAVELRRWRARALMSAGDHAAASTALADLPDGSEMRELLAFLAVALTGVAVPDYVAILRRFAAQNPSRTAQARAFLIEDALRRGLIVHAFELAMSVRPGTIARGHVDLVLRVVARLLFDRDPDGNLAVESDRLEAALLEVVRYLSAHPGDGAVRLRLTRMLSVEVSGSLGLPLIASIAVKLINRPRSCREKPVIHPLSPEELGNRDAFFKSAFGWLEAETPIIVGRAVLPASLLPEDVDKVAAAIQHLLIALGGAIKDDKDVKEILNWLALGTSLAPHTSDPDQDLGMIQLAASRLGLAGRVQHARDLSEQALQAAGDNPKRQRAAWFVMADVYHRVGNNLESLIALACAAAGDPDVDAEQAWEEVNALARLLRDIGLFELARGALGTANDLLHQMGFAQANQHRLETMRIQIDMKELSYRPETLPRALPDLLRRIVANAHEVLSRHDDPAPVGVMLGQMIRMAAASGVSVPPEAQEKLEELLKNMGTAASSLVRAVSASHPTGADVLVIHQQTERARYSDDVAYDTRNAVMAARSLLSGEEAAQDPEVAVFAIELLADRAIAMPGWETTAKPLPAITAVSEPAGIAKQISKDGLSIVLAGINDDGHIMRITVAAGELGAVQREDENIFSFQRLRAWTREFPYRYGIDESTANLFHISTEGLGVAALPEGRVVLVWDTELQPLPPNLLRIGDTFAGHTRPMAAAPSLSWLAAARSGKATTTDQMAAWISTEERQGSTLAMIADRLGPTFAEHGIHLDTSPAIPEGLVSSEMVIVAAHGGTIPDGNYFQRVSDEGELEVVAGEMANALRNVGVVILFVCSGGRADKHPSGSTIVGLAKQLLDRGCSAVIASPWPLDSRVPYHWLPAFMEAWRRGLPLADANFKANAAVARGLGDSPAKSLAMTVFGDPLRTTRV